MLVHTQDLARFAADGILNSLVAGIAVGLLAWVVTRMLRRQGSAVRFIVWLFALAAIVLLPFAGTTHKLGSAPRAFTLPELFASYLFSAWIIGVTLGLAQVVHGLYRLRRLRATCNTVDLHQLDPIMRDVLVAARQHRSVALCTSEVVRVPAAIGYFRPMVVFPSWAFAEIAPAELNAIFLHELAHLRRYDDWTNLAQKLIKVLFFFHPAVWFIESRLTLEREMACDDAVLAASFSPRAYAESLVGLAEKSFLRRGVQLAQAAVSQVQQLKLRLAEILRKDRAQSGQGSGDIRRATLAVLSLAGVVSLYGVAHAPRLVAFSEDLPLVAATSASTPTVSLPADVGLPPTNLSYVDHSAPRTVKPACLRVSRRAAPQSHIVETQGAAAEKRIANEYAAPAMLLANLPLEVASAPVLVVFQGEQFGANGPVFWRVTIVHLTPAQQRAITGGFPKQI